MYIIHTTIKYTCACSYTPNHMGTRTRTQMLKRKHTLAQIYNSTLHTNHNKIVAGLYTKCAYTLICMRVPKNTPDENIIKHSGCIQMQHKYHIIHIYNPNNGDH